MNSVQHLILKMLLKLNLNSFCFSFCLISLLYISNCEAQSNCFVFLDSNKSRVDFLCKKAKSTDKFWIKNFKLLSIVLPEYISESEVEIGSEISIFKTLSLFKSNEIYKISLGPFQMQPIFIYQELLQSKSLNRQFNFDGRNKELDLIKLTNSIDKFVTIDFQLAVLKCFILRESKKLKQKPLKSLVTLSGIYNGISNANALSNKKFFTKLKCHQFTYTEWAIFLMNYYFK